MRPTNFYSKLISKREDGVWDRGSMRWVSLKVVYDIVLAVGSKVNWYEREKKYIIIRTILHLLSQRLIPLSPFVSLPLRLSTLLTEKVNFITRILHIWGKNYCHIQWTHSYSQTQWTHSYSQHNHHNEPDLPSYVLSLLYMIWESTTFSKRLLIKISLSEKEVRRWILYCDLDRVTHRRGVWSVSTIFRGSAWVTKNKGSGVLVNK